jgi:tripartite-type tricarboxylate transporter receptor subunit TctC
MSRILSGCFLGAVASLALLLGPAPARPADTPDFKGQKITMLIGFAAGGGTDVSGRLLAPFLAKHLPGQPTIIVQNMPGAFGINAVNFMLNQTKPDGLVFSVGANSQVDPMNYRKAGHYDPTKFHYFGGIGRGGYAIVVSKDGEKRLHDLKQKPVVMGSVGGWPRAAMQITVWGVEFLGWNARWVTGYQGTNDLMIALDRGEIDMTATGNMFQLKQQVESGKFAILTQSGALVKGKFVGRADLPGVPVFTDQMAGKITDPLAVKAFKYWASITATDKFLALPPDTPKPIVDAYNQAFIAAAKDPELLAMSEKISDDFAPMSAQDMTMLVQDLADTPPQVVDYLTRIFAKQGLKMSE